MFGLIAFFAGTLVVPFLFLVVLTLRRRSARKRFDLLCDDGCGTKLGFADRPQKGQRCDPCRQLRDARLRDEFEREKDAAENMQFSVNEALAIRWSSSWDEKHPGFREAVQEIIDQAASDTKGIEA